MKHLLSCLLYICVGVSFTNANEFDTYNADECKRVRRSWKSLTTTERQLYVDGLMELRLRGNSNISVDELVGIASVHEDQYGEIVHSASSYLFWHGYLLWELESRIRNLGGKYKCFAVPYWDFTTESDRETLSLPLIFDDIVGGDGDPNNYWSVNMYSWNYTTEQYWVPAHCDAHGDQYPLCSLKRAFSPARVSSAARIAQLIVENTEFADFSNAYADDINLPHLLLTNVDYLTSPVITSYDPIWFLFHSMVSYHQALWIDCNDYDLIPPQELDDHPEAYTPFCIDGTACGAMGLDDVMYFGGYLPHKQWSFIYGNALTVRKSYHFPRWNIIYDLGDVDAHGFYMQSHLDQYCKGKLNDDWFIVNSKQDLDDKILETLESTSIFSLYLSYNQLWIGFFALMITAITAAMLWCSFKTEKEGIKSEHQQKYNVTVNIEDINGVTLKPGFDANKFDKIYVNISAKNMLNITDAVSSYMKIINKWKYHQKEVKNKEKEKEKESERERDPRKKKKKKGNQSDDDDDEDDGDAGMNEDMNDVNDDDATADNEWLRVESINGSGDVEHYFWNKITNETSWNEPSKWKDYNEQTDAAKDENRDNEDNKENIFFSR